MKFALFSFTDRGSNTAEIISQGLKKSGSEARVFIMSKESKSIMELMSDLFLDYDALVFVSACGIAVRAIAPHIKSKATDPAVVVCDEFGQHIIPILSGYIGGANEIAVDIALITGGKAVLTTATDMHGVLAADVWAKKNSLVISNIDMVKLVSAKLMRGEKIGFFSEYPYEGALPPGIWEKDLKCGIYIGGNREKSPFAVTLALAPKNLVLGISCKRYTTREQIEGAVQFAGVPLERVTKLCSIDIKANEPGLLDFAEANGIDTEFFNAESLMHLGWDFNDSDLVNKATGSDNVCERAAVLGGVEGKLIKRKTVLNGVTVAVFEKSFTVKF